MVSKEIKVLGLDLGGTNMTAAVVTGTGKILYKTGCATNAKKGRAYVIDTICALLGEALAGAGLKKKDIAGIGLGVPGPLNSETGIVSQAPNLPDWHNVPIRDIIKARMGLPVYLENDANAAAVAEYEIGAGKKVKDMILLTLGTGIGGGIILGGELWKGPDNSAGEVGHLIVNTDNGRLCGCGAHGCLEAHASASAMIRQAKELIRRRCNTVLAKEKELSAKNIFDAARKGDAVSKAIVFEMLVSLTAGITSLVNLLNVEMIVLGGGISAAGSYILKPLREGVKKTALKLPGKRAKIEFGKIGTDAGVIGAALCFLKHMNKNGSGKKKATKKTR